ncbi:hypothetical protein Tco_0243180 [Tanacetum coccineum]
MLQIFSQRLLMLADLTFWLLALDYLISEDVFVRVMIDEFPQTSVPIPNVADEAVFKVRDDRVVRATTTAASLDATQTSGNITETQSTTMSNDPLSHEIGSGDRPRCQEAMGGAIAQTWSERTSKHSYDSSLLGVNTPKSDEERNEQRDLTDFVPPTPHDSPLSGVHTHRSDEGRPNINELMAICINLSNRVLALEHSKTAQDLVINKLRKGLDKENVSKQRRKSDKTKPMFKDSDFDVLDDAMENVEGGSTAKQITTAGDTLNTASINVSTTVLSNGSAAGPFTMIRNVEKEPRRATPVPTVQSQEKGKGKMVEPEPTPKNPRKAQIQMDEELAQRMDADELLAARLQEKEREQFSVDEQARFLVETIAARKKFFASQRAADDDSEKKDDSSIKQAESSKKRPRAEHDEESVKKHAEKEELRACLDIVQGDDIAIDVESLATKYRIVD